MSHIPRTALVLAAASMLVLSVHGQSNGERIRTNRDSTTLSPMDPLTEAIELNVAEVYAARLAIVRSDIGYVKTFAAKMLKDSTEAAAKLRAVPEAPKGLVRPSARDKAIIDNLSKKFGEDFNRTYIDVVISSSKDMLSVLEHKTTQAIPIATGNDSSMARIAGELLLMTRLHLKESKQIQGELSGFLQPDEVRQGPNVFSDNGELPAAGPDGNADNRKDKDETQ